jgi:hypothetical protein
VEASSGADIGASWPSGYDERIGPPLAGGRIRGAGSGRSRQVIELDDLAHLDLDLLEQVTIPLGVLDGLRPVLRVDQPEATNDLLGLGERPIGRRDRRTPGLADQRSARDVADQSAQAAVALVPTDAPAFKTGPEAERKASILRGFSSQTMVRWML